MFYDKPQIELSELLKANPSQNEIPAVDLQHLMQILVNTTQRNSNLKKEDLENFSAVLDCIEQAAQDFKIILLLVYIDQATLLQGIYDLFDNREIRRLQNELQQLQDGNKDNQNDKQIATLQEEITALQQTIKIKTQHSKFDLQVFRQLTTNPININNIIKILGSDHSKKFVNNINNNKIRPQLQISTALIDSRNLSIKNALTSFRTIIHRVSLYHGFGKNPDNLQNSHPITNLFRPNSNNNHSNNNSNDNLNNNSNNNYNKNS